MATKFFFEGLRPTSVLESIWEKLCSSYVLIFFGFFLVFLGNSAQAGQAASMRKDAVVYADRFLDARVIGDIKAGEKVEIIELKSSWARVQHGKTKGWVRALNLQAVGQSNNVLSGLSQLESGRSGRGNQISTTGIRSLPKASRHALIITIGDYSAPGINDLKGVRFDADSAKRMALGMSIPETNIRFLKDAEATREGMVEAFKDLSGRVRPGDRVFVYYSGHGTRWVDAAFDPNSCTEGLLTHEGDILSNREISQSLKPIGATADKLMVFYDACHSGGIISAPTKTRAIKLATTVLSPKFAGTVSPEMCSKPTNMKTRSLSGELGRGGIQKDNVVFIAASRPSEVSFDDPNSGGLATQSFRDCLLGEAKDLDQSGAISIAEVTLCAQSKLDAKLSGQPDILGQKMIIGGNSAFVPTFLDSKPDAQPETSSPSAATAQASGSGPNKNTVPNTIPNTTPNTSDNSEMQVVLAPPSPGLEPSVPATQPGKLRPADLLQEIYQQRDAKRRLILAANPPKMRIKKDRLGLRITPSHDGFLYLVLAGSDNQSLYLLFPNELDSNNAVRAGQTINLPAKGWRIRASGPAGVSSVLAIVTDSPRDLSSLKGEPTGPFVRSLFSQEGNSQLQAMFNTSGNADQALCQEGGKTRNLTVEKECSDSYSASFIEIEELDSQ